MAPLIALGAALAPEIVRWLAGPKAGDVAEKVSDVVRTVTGTDDPHAAEAAIAADPAKALEAKVALAGLAAQQEGAVRAAELEAFKAGLADTANARGQMTALAQQKHPLAYGAAMVTLWALGTLTYIVVHLWESMNEATRYLLVGQIIAFAAAAVAYWIGTSRGAVEMRQGLQRQDAPRPAGPPAA